MSTSGVVRNLLVAFGVAGAMLLNLQMLVPNSSLQTSALAGSSSFYGISYAICLAVLGVVSYLAQRLDARRTVIEVDLALAVLLAILYTGFDDFALPPQVASTLITLRGLLYVYLGAEALIRWNLPMTLNSIADLPLIVSLSIIVSLMLFTVQTILPDSFVRAFVSIAVCLSFLCLHETERLYIGNPESPYSLARARAAKHVHPDDPHRHGRNRWFFFTSRALWGVALIYLVTLRDPVEHQHATSPNLVAFIMAALTLAAVALVLAAVQEKRVPRQLTYFLPVASTLVLSLAFARHDGSITITTLTMGAWLAWRVQSYMQLPSYRTILALDPEVFALISRFSSAIPYAIGALILPGSSLRLTSIQVQFGTSALVNLAVVALTTIFTIRHVVRYYPSAKNAAPSASSSPDGTQQLNISTDWGLTERETEVATLLSQGYSRPYIEKVLCIASSTAKSHIYHVYRKAGVNSQDEFIDLVRGRS